MTFWEKYLQEIRIDKNLYNFYTERSYNIIRRNTVEKWAKDLNKQFALTPHHSLHPQAMNVQKYAKSQ